MPNISQEKYDKLKALLEITTNGLTKTEFLESFKKILERLSELEQKLIEKIDFKTQAEKDKMEELRREFEQVIEEAKAESDNSLSGFKRKTVELVNSLFAKSKVNQKLSSVLTDVDMRLRAIDDKMAQIRDGYDGRDGKDGQDADETKIVEEVMKKIDLSSFDEMMDELRKEIEELKARPVRMGGGGTNYMGIKQHFIDDETPSGTVNGANKAFTIANTPNPSGSLKVYVNGQRMRLTEDYTFSGKTITFGTAPPTGSILLVDYRK